MKRIILSVLFLYVFFLSTDVNFVSCQLFTCSPQGILEISDSIVGTAATNNHHLFTNHKLPSLHPRSFCRNNNQHRINSNNLCKQQHHHQKCFFSKLNFFFLLHFRFIDFRFRLHQHLQRFEKKYFQSNARNRYHRNHPIHKQHHWKINK